MIARRALLLVSFVVALFVTGLVWPHEPLRWSAVLFGAWALAVAPALIFGRGQIKGKNR